MLRDQRLVVCVRLRTMNQLPGADPATASGCQTPGRKGYCSQPDNRRGFLLASNRHSIPFNQPFATGLKYEESVGWPRPTNKKVADPRSARRGDSGAQRRFGSFW
jgi:hypothetical protein